MYRHIEHGDVSMEWQGNLLVIRAQNAFNLEGIKRGKVLLEDAVGQKILQSPRQPWGRLAVIDDEALPTLDCCEMIKESFDWVAQRGCAAAAIVSEHNALFRFLLADVKLCIGFFDNEIEAKNWLNQQINNAKFCQDNHLRSY